MSQKKLSIKELQADFKGKLVGPSDLDFDTLRTVFYGGIDRKPALIILAANAQDVQKGVNLARETGLELAVRSGGHSFAGQSVCEGGIVLDLRHLNSYTIDEKTQTAWVEPGIKAGEFTKAADKHDLVLGFGDTGSVGVGGITVGGGVGFLVRKFGLTIDNLLAAEVVTADGKLLVTDEKNHPDLFWAIRGGGGNFGVATRFKFKLHRLTEVVGGMLFLPATADVLAGFMELAKQAPDELSVIANIMPAPPMPFLPAEHHGKIVLMAIMLYAGSAELGEQVLAPFKKLATPLADTVKPMRYKDIFFPDDDSYHPTAVAQTLFIDNVDKIVAELVLSQLAALDAPMRVAQLRVLGGAYARVPADQTAYAHRSSQIMVNLAAFYENQTEQKERQTWVENFSRQLNQGDASVYVNFLGVGDEKRVADAYPGATGQRLAEIKQQYDPENLFRHNINILPKRSP